MVETELSLAHQKLHAFNRALSTVIRTGIFFSLALMVAGLLIYTVRGDTAEGKLTPLFSLPGQLVKLDPTSFITLGLYILLLMPPVILLTSFAHFISARQKKPVIVCAVLIALIVVSMVMILAVH
jgi:uncharacterized membrane protein